jgi:branched-chain amino acid transport system substrate-binding protein
MKNALFIPAVLSALVAGGPAFAEIKIGIMVPTSGSLATYGIDMENAIKMAAEDINAKGGVLGQKIVTFTADDGCDPQMATAAASKLVSQGMNAVVGGFCSGSTLATLKIYSDAGVPLLVTNANSSKFIAANPGNAFLINALATYQVDTAMELFKKHAIKTIALVHQGDAYSEDLASLTRKKWEAMGKQVLAYEMVNPGEQDQSSLVTRLKGKNPEMVFWTAYFADGALLIKQLRQAGYRGKITVADGSVDPHLIEIGGKATEGVFALSLPLPEFLPGGKGQDFIPKYKAKYHVDPGPCSPLCYDGMMLMADAMRRAGGTDAKAVIAALKATKAYPGLAGPIAFDSNNNLAQSNFITLTVKNAKWALAR